MRRRILAFLAPIEHAARRPACAHRPVSPASVRVRLVDVNVLVYAVNEDAEHHVRSNEWLRTALSGDEEVGFAWLVIIGFLRVTTRWMPAIGRSLLEQRHAWAVVDAWLQASAAELVDPGVHHFDIVRSLLESAGRGGELVPDAHLAALAIEHRAELVTFDTDFARFPGLRWQRLRLSEAGSIPSVPSEARSATP